MSRRKTQTAEPAEPTAPAPGDEGYDWAGEYPGAEVFLWTSQAGRTVGLPRFEQAAPPMEWYRKNRHLDKLEMIFQTLERCATEATFEAVAELSPVEYVAWYNAWQEDSGIDEGK